MLVKARVALVPQIFKYIMCRLVQSAPIHWKPGGHGTGGTWALSFQIHFVLPGSKCTNTLKARRAWHGWHLCLMLPLPARRSRRALVHCLKMLSYSAPPSAHYNLVLTYNALPITKYCTAGACLRRCPGSLATCPGRGTTLGRKTWALTSASSIITGP